MANKILTVSELATHLNVHRITIYRLLKSGSLPGFKIGRVWRFDLDEIGNWMSSGKSAAAIKAATDGVLERPANGPADSMMDGHDGQQDGSRGSRKGRADGKLPDVKARKPPASSEGEPRPKRR